MDGKGMIHFEHKGIGHTLADRRLAVPLNQREYAWEDQHILDLFRDLADAIATDGAEYFLGTIVLTQDSGGDPEVSDGQQRFATVTILIAAIRDFMLAHGNAQRADTIERDYLRTTDLRTEEIVPRLRLNVADNEFFKKAILSRPDSAERDVKAAKPSHLKIRRAAELAAQHVQDIVAPHKEAAQIARLIDWVDFVRSRARVVLVTVPDSVNAFIMFETLNDRGLPLAQSDLLKNYLLGKAADRIAEVQQRWATMAGALETVGGDDITVTYLRHYVISTHGPTRERELYVKVKELIKSKQAAVDFADSLSDSANDYVALLNPLHHEKWNAHGTSTRRHVATIKELGIEQIRPLMFAVARHFSVDEAKKAFRLFVCWSVRFLIVGGRGGLLDQHYGMRAHEIGTGSLKTTKALARAMEDVVPNDATFEAAFATAKVSRNFLARYYLRALELQVKGENEPELVPNEEEQVITLEHILPQTPSAGWKIDEETATAYYKRLGNMALLQAKVNTAVGNGSFKDKRAFLKQSAFVLTSEVGSAANWAVQEIEGRQKRLAGLAVETWPLAIR